MSSYQPIQNFFAFQFQQYKDRFDRIGKEIAKFEGRDWACSLVYSTAVDGLVFKVVDKATSKPALVAMVIDKEELKDKDCFDHTTGIWFDEISPLCGFMLLRQRERKVCEDGLREHAWSLIRDFCAKLPQSYEFCLSGKDDEYMFFSAASEEESVSFAVVTMTDRNFTANILEATKGTNYFLELDKKELLPIKQGLSLRSQPYDYVPKKKPKQITTPSKKDPMAMYRRPLLLGPRDENEAA